MDFASVEIYDFSGYRFYYGLGERAYILVETNSKMVDLNSMQVYDPDKIHALMRLSLPNTHYIHDNLEVRLDKSRIDQIVQQYPDYSHALNSELEKLSIFASNLRFYQKSLVDKIEEIMDDYSGTKYHETELEKRHFVSRLISNFDRYIRLDELPLNWLNFIDCLTQVPSSSKIHVFNTWRSFLVTRNYKGSDYPSFYYKFSRSLLNELEDNLQVSITNLNENNLDSILNADNIRINNYTVSTNNPIRYI